MPGMTYLPCRSMTCAEGGVFNAADGPTQGIRPLSRIMAAWATGARPVPSISVKFLRTLTSASKDVANNSNQTGGDAISNSSEHLRESSWRATD